MIRYMINGYELDANPVYLEMTDFLAGIRGWKRRRAQSGDFRVERRVRRVS